MRDSAQPHPTRGGPAGTVTTNALRAGSVAAAAVLIGGVVVVALPHHAASVARIVIVTVAAAAGLHALTVHVPAWTATGWTASPFDLGSGDATEENGSGEIDRVRSRFSGRRHPVEDGPHMPPQVLRLLQPLIRVALEREGLDPGNEANAGAVRARLSPLAWAVWRADPLRPPPLFGSRRPDERRVADAVRQVLDEIETLDIGQHAHDNPGAT